ncbi:TonB-dependent receptor [Prolixibacteraceae bacterium Z1-6]|uniref:TonB-dependent receptor n=1 Tax=Draconibacterium aestuarii TaxID=2998507 RepID=A0A9X3F805_9BACT|nr:TonB-dependent receptor [Prolixibacteraceae bacterium Z1-6]
MKKIALMLFCIAMFGVLVVEAQVKSISGTVTSSEDGTGIPGVSVSVKGTTIGTVTNIEGEYQIDVPEDAEILIFSFVGMKTQELPITGTKLNAVLDPETIDIGEVMVVAYGTVSPEAKTGAVTQVRADQIADVPVSSFDKVLSGKLAGVTVTATSGQPGAASQIRIRGTSSINAGNEPLYVIDGVPVMSGDQSYFTNTSNALSMLNPNDIESVTVLKDAAAASVYGSRAANGVVLVTTKSGAAGVTKFAVRAKYGVSQLANDNNYGTMTPEQLLEYHRTGVRNAGANPDDPANANSGMYYPYELLSRPQTNWMDAFTRLGNTQEYEISANGGTEKTKYFTSASYHSTEGVFHGVSFDKMQFRVNVDHVINDQLKIGTRINTAYTESNDVAMQSLYYANPAFAGMLILPWTPLHDENGMYNLNIPENAYTNPRATAEYDDQWEKQYRLLGNMYLEWEPTTGLILKTSNSAELTFGEGRRYWSDDAQFEPSADDVALQTSNSNYRQLTTSNTASYSTVYNNHNIKFLAGQEATMYDYYSYYVWAPGVDPDMPYLNTSISDTDDADYDNSAWTLLSFFGIFDYNYLGKYYFQASYRADGSSRFGTDTKWGDFYSVGASWNIHEEGFMANLNWIDFLKLRASYGVSGNNDIGNYDQFGVYGARQYNGNSGLAPDNLSNPELSWETNTAYNIGLDINFLKKFNANIDVYKRITSDMLLDKPLSRTTGFTSITTNIGELSNKGIEFQLESKILSGEVKWNVSMNIARNISEVLDLAGNDQIESDYSSRLFYVVGEQLFTYYLYDYEGVDPTSGNALWRTEDGQLTSDYNKARRYFAGSPEPDWYGGLSSNVSWKGLALNVAMEYKIGNEVLIEENRYLNSDGYNWNSNQANTALDYWTTPGQVASNPKPIYNNSTNSSGFRSTRWMQRGDYLRIKDITLSYSLPSRITDKLNLGAVKVYGSGYNVFTFHDVDFWDPERGVDGMGFGIYPMTKTYVMGLDIMF